MGRDVRVSDKRIQGYRFFINKIWNAGKFVLANIKGFEPKDVTPDPAKLGLAEKWILTELNRTIRDARLALDEYRYNDTADILYQFTWHTYCDWYIELSKSMLNAEGAPYTRWVLHYVLKSILELLHPIIPFVTEEIWQCLPGRVGESIVIASYPKARPELDFADDAELMSYIIEVISGVRSIRGETGISPDVVLDVAIRVPDAKLQSLLSANSIHIKDLGRPDLEYALPLDSPIVAVLTPRKLTEEPTAAEAAAAAEAGPAEPEVITEKKPTEEEAEGEGEKGKGQGDERHPICPNARREVSVLTAPPHLPRASIRQLPPSRPPLSTPYPRRRYGGIAAATQPAP
jgi:valyl-tRNA synthetase